MGGEDRSKGEGRGRKGGKGREGINLPHGRLKALAALIIRTVQCCIVFHSCTPL